MKVLISQAVFALISVNASKLSSPDPIRPAELHWNEDPHSRPDPLSGANQFGYKTSTQARLESEGLDIHIRSTEPNNENPSTKNAYRPWNTNDKEYVQEREESGSESESDSESESESESSSSDSESESSGDDHAKVQIRNRSGLKWRVSPDYGELDANVIGRESDIANGYKAGAYGLTAWHNPLMDADIGQDDDQVLSQTRSDIRYDQSEGPTKVDMGELDQVVVNREHDIANGYKYGGYGLTAWHNPLMDADDGQDDESIL